MASRGGFWGRINDVDIDDVDALRRAGVQEGPRLEYKGAAFSLSAERLSDSLCAMANTSGGRIVVGVEADNKTERIVGWDPIAAAQVGAAQNRVASAAMLVQPPVQHFVRALQVGSLVRRPRRPPSAPATVRRSVRDGVLIIDVHADGRGPRQSRGRYLQRIGSHTDAMPHVSLVAAIIQAQNARGREQDEATWLQNARLLKNPLGPEPALLVALRAAADLSAMCDPLDGEVADSIVARFAARGMKGARAGRDAVTWRPTPSPVMSALMPGQECFVGVRYRGEAYRASLAERTTNRGITAFPRETLVGDVEVLANLLGATGYQGEVEVWARLIGNSQNEPIDVAWAVLGGRITWSGVVGTGWPMELLGSEPVGVIESDAGAREALAERFLRLLQLETTG